MNEKYEGSRFELVTVAGARARQLLRGCTPRVPPSERKVKTALREVASGEVEKTTPPPPERLRTSSR